MKVLVTGGTGFIGSHVVRELLQRGHEVHALIRPTARLDRIDDVLDCITTWPVDLLDGPAVDAAVSTIGAAGVLHLAWYAEPEAYLQDVSQNLASLEAGIRLLRALAGGPAGRLVLAGTCLEDIRHGESRPAYAVAKRALHDVAANCGDPGLSVACAHVFSVFGPWEDHRRAVPSVIRSLLAGQPAEVGTGAALRDYLFVADLASALVTILESDVVGRIDVCSGEAQPLQQVFKEIGRATGAPELLRFGARADNPDHAFDAVGDPSGLQSLGWRPARSFAGRMDDTVAWWQPRAPIPTPLGSGR